LAKNICRGFKWLAGLTDVFTCHAFLPAVEGADAAFSTAFYNHVVLFPHMSDGLSQKAADSFHDITYHSLLSGPAKVAPVTRALSVPGPGGAMVPVFLLSFRTLVPGDYQLSVNARWVWDRPGSSIYSDAAFVGESEGRVCAKGSPMNWCMHAVTQDGTLGAGCNKVSEVTAGVTVKVERPQSAAPPDYLALPLARSAEASPDGFWLRVGDSLEHCYSEEQQAINARVVEGDPCRLGDPDLPNSPVYTWISSNVRCVRASAKPDADIRRSWASGKSARASEASATEEWSREFFCGGSGRPKRAQRRL
jgi:hypothetical protein